MYSALIAICLQGREFWMNLTVTTDIRVQALVTINATAIVKIIKIIAPKIRPMIPPGNIIIEERKRIIQSQKASPLVRIGRTKEICIPKLKIVRIRRHEGNDVKSFTFLTFTVIRRINKKKIKFRVQKISSNIPGKLINNTKITINTPPMITKLSFIGRFGSIVSFGIICSLIEFYIQYFTSLIYHGMQEEKVFSKFTKEKLTSVTFLFVSVFLLLF
jgi:hypothetical protein